MLKPLQQWCCDSCGGIIDGPADGCIEWNVEQRTQRVSGHRIVHQSPECTYRSIELATMWKTPAQVALNPHTGHTHLANMLGLLHDMVASGWVDAEDEQGFVEVMRRTQLPYYEEARLFWNVSLQASVHDGTKYDEQTLLHILQWKESELMAGLEALQRRRVASPF
ncbi:MAG: hypothetical protein JW846_06775 [Dehalococcoidia bacterium]|nr:hypothetical protein [Dehalococcoidia bacterium]